MNKIREVSKEDFLQELKNAAIGGIDDIVDMANEVVEEDKEINEEVQESFKKYNKSLKKKKDLKIKKLEFELLNKDNPVLKEYIALLDKIDEAEKETKENDGILYESMVKGDVKNLESDLCKITLKKPYLKKDFNFKLFKEDYKENSRMYKRYVSEKTVKGNLVVTMKED